MIKKKVSHITVVCLSMHVYTIGEYFPVYILVHKLLIIY